MTGRPKRLSTVFRRALGALRKRGWTQGTLGGKTGPCCALGLIALGCGGAQPADFGGAIEKRAWGVFRTVIGEPSDETIVDWNDAPDRTRGDVIKAFKRAEARALKQEIVARG